MKLWYHLLKKLQEQCKVYLLTVTENFGSSPGRKGFKMIVSDDDFIFGSIGGGIMEYETVEKVKQLFIQHESPIFLKKLIHRGRIKDGSGMICSGEQTVVFHPLGKNDISTIRTIIGHLESNKQGVLELNTSSLLFSSDEISSQYNFEKTTSDNWTYKELLGFKNKLYIVGGGHVSLAVSDLFVTLGFHVTVLDNRSNLNTFNLNKSAHQKLIIDYDQIENHLTEGSNSYVAIMTNTYIDDKLVLSKIIRNQYSYIGVLGSIAKLNTMWQVLQEEGFTDKELSNINAPIGIAINSQTPEEIAVSIAAKVIEKKNSNKK